MAQAQETKKNAGKTDRNIRISISSLPASLYLTIRISCLHLASNNYHNQKLHHSNPNSGGSSGLSALGGGTGGLSSSFNSGLNNYGLSHNNNNHYNGLSNNSSLNGSGGSTGSQGGSLPINGYSHYHGGGHHHHSSGIFFSLIVVTYHSPRNESKFCYLLFDPCT